jgi:hypothetical protein
MRTRSWDAAPKYLSAKDLGRSGPARRDVSAYPPTPYDDKFFPKVSA